MLGDLRIKRRDFVHLRGSGQNLVSLRWHRRHGDQLRLSLSDQGPRALDQLGIQRRILGVNRSLELTDALVQRIILRFQPLDRRIELCHSRFVFRYCQIMGYLYLRIPKHPATNC